MMAKLAKTDRPIRNGIIKVHRWASVAAALFWLVQAITGVLLSFHFEIGDAALSNVHHPTDPVAIQERIDDLASAGPEAEVHWIWTTAGLPDRYVIAAADPEGNQIRVRINGDGSVLSDRPVDRPDFLGLAHAVHLTLLAGPAGHWILAVSGMLLVSNIILGLVVAWPRKGMWRRTLVPARRGSSAALLLSWHRAVGLWVAIPALIIVGMGTLILFEHEIRDLLGAPEVELPANLPNGPGVDFAAAREAAIAAIPGSRFVGTTLPTPEDASYYAWVRAPGELYRGGYGGSLVVVDANDASVRRVYPATEADAAHAFIGSFYPLHTGEAFGLVGRMAGMMTGLWLIATIVLGTLLWLKRRPARKARDGIARPVPKPDGYA